MPRIAPASTRVHAHLPRRGRPAPDPPCQLMLRVGWAAPPSAAAAPRHQALGQNLNSKCSLRQQIPALVPHLVAALDH